MDIREGEQGDGLATLFFREASLIVSHSVFALFCLKASEPLVYVTPLVLNLVHKLKCKTILILFFPIMPHLPFAMMMFQGHVQKKSHLQESCV